MERTLTYLITEKDAGNSIQQYLRALGFSSRSLIVLKKYEAAVLLNGESVYLNRILSPGDFLQVLIREEASSEKIPPRELPLHIRYEDEDLMVINKPTGMPIHPSMNHYESSLANALAYYFQKQNIPFVFRCINRLDKDTSGLTIVAKHMVSAGILSATPIMREYLAITKGKVTPSSGIITAPIARKEGSVIEREVNFARGERAVTHYRVLAYKNEHTLLSLQLETGRTHQIRVHMKFLGYPLIGDFLYNPDLEHIGRQALHSHRLQFIHPITRKPLEFTAPLPADMNAVLESTHALEPQLP